MRWLAVLVFWSCSAVAGVVVEVQGSGSTVEQAKQRAFQRAVEQVVGTVIVSDQEVQKDKLIKDRIGNYSAGYIEDYEILDTWENDFDLDQERWTVRMKAKVAKSKIAERMLSRAENSQNIHGPKVYDTMRSEVEMRDRGTQLLTQVLDSYPNNAYIINSGATEFKVGRVRQPYVDIDYNITMSKSWVEAFNEAMSLVAVDSKKCNTLSMSVSQSVANTPTVGQGVKNLAQKVCGSEPDVRVFFKSSGDFFAQAHNYYLPDYLMLESINRNFQAGQNLQFVAVKLDLLDANGQTIDSRCTSLNNQIFVAYENPKGDYNLRERWLISRPSVMGQNKLEGTFRVHLKTLEQIENLSRIRMSVEKSCS